MRKSMLLSLIAVLVSNCAAMDTVPERNEAVEIAPRAQTSAAQMTEAILEIERALGTDRQREIRERYEKPYKMDPKNPFARFLWAYSLEDRNEAWQELIKITKLNDHFYWAYLGMGIILDGWKVDDQTESNLKRAIVLSPQLGIAYGRLGRFYLRKKDSENALLQLQKAVEKDPLCTEYKMDLARALVLADKAKEAISLYQQIIDKDKSSFPAHQEFGELLLKTGDKEGAIQILGKAADLDANSYETRFMRSELLESLGRNDEALAAYQEACRVNSASLPCWQSLARLSGKMSNREVQVVSYEHILQMDKGNLEAHKYLAPVYMESGEIEKALPCFLSILRKEKDNVDAMVGLANLYERGGELTKAVEYNLKAIKAQPGHAESKAMQKRLFVQFHILTEPISGKTPDQVFGKNRSQIASVYKTRLKSVPTLKGDLLIKVTVANDGSVESAVVSKDTLGDQVLELCAIWNLRRSIFPSGIGASYDFELSLRPGD
jgi:tetratricopeptide (TPR) repeat protein